jgi:hypothetical protein
MAVGPAVTSAEAWASAEFLIAGLCGLVVVIVFWMCSTHVVFLSSRTHFGFLGQVNDISRSVTMQLFFWNSA